MHSLKLRLSSYSPQVEEIEAPISFVPEYRGPQKVFPDIQRLPDGRLAVDWWKSADGKILVKAWGRAPYPNINLLPASCPRIVKALYSEAGQLRLLRMTEFPFAEFGAILNAWETFARNVRPDQNGKNSKD